MSEWAVGNMSETQELDDDEREDSALQVVDPVDAFQRLEDRA